MFPIKLRDKANKIIKLCRSKKLIISSAESCTGGLIAACLTEIPGASAVFDRGIVCYSDLAKIEELGVEEETISTYGAVSSEVAGEMAKGMLKISRATLAISVTGIAGPNGGTEEKPVGLVYIGVFIDQKSPMVHRQMKPLVERHIFIGNRCKVREQTVVAALNLILGALAPLLGK